MVRGQVNGCCVLGLGYGLTEAVVREQGRMLNGSLTDYLVPTVHDMPEIADYVAVEDEYKYSGFGAKGVGELCLIATPLAIVNAVYDATGVRFHELPLNREDVFFALQER
jgi:CO/xanthine dehydrogenase Mo-binding subunit